MAVFYGARTRNNHLKVVAYLMVAVVLVACTATPTPVASKTEISPVGETGRLTPEGWWPYQVTTAGTKIAVRNIGSGRNNRELFWDPNLPDTTRATQCATWESGVDIAQNGFAFRIDEQPDGSINAIVFVQNIYMRLFWTFAPKIFHTGDDYGEDWDSPPSIELDEYLGASTEAAIYPLRVCASLSSEDVLCFAIAKGNDPMPPLTRPGRQGGCWWLNIYEHYHDEQGLEGKNGIFVGHVPIGTSLVIDDYTIDVQPVPPPG